MVIMNNFAAYCSVRLGTIITALLSIIQSIIIISLGLSVKIQEFQSIAKEHDDEVKEEGGTTTYGYVDIVINWIERNSKTVQTFVFVFISLHVITSLAAIMGALKLNRILLIPFISMEFVRLIAIFFVHVIAMIVLKEKMNLGELITVSVAGGFVILFLGYLWACVVALFQILTLIRTEKYQSLYGNSPLGENFEKNSRSEFSKHPSDQLIKVNVIDNSHVYQNYNSNSQYSKNLVTDTYSGYTFTERNKVPLYVDRDTAKFFPNNQIRVTSRFN